MTKPLFETDDSQLDPDQVLTHMANPTVLRRWEGSLREMVEIAEVALRKKLGDHELVPELARQAVFAICDTVGGSVIYLPRGEMLKKAMRDAAIFHEWKINGAKPHQLARKYRLADQTIYDIIARQRALHRRSEPDLFGFDESPPQH